MKKTVKRLLSTLMTLIMLLAAIPFGGIDFGALFAPRTSAKDISSYSVGDIITYGSYPQSRVTNSSLISALEKAGSKLLWVDYGYYAGTGSGSDGNMKPVENMMRYKDIFYNGNMYRAVEINKYRPYYTGYKSSSSYTYQDDNGYYTGNTYYFRYDPLTWRVLDPAEGFVMCTTAIDAQAYNNYYVKSSGSYYGNSTKAYYASDWANSSLRYWLNNDFYSTAFSSTEKSQINTTYNENKSTQNSKYDSADTSDKIFLLSHNEVLNSKYGFSSSYSAYDTARQLKSTDYAKCQGCYEETSTDYYGNSWWHLRSPGFSSSAASVNYGGYAYYSNNVNNTSDGVAPAFKFNLKSAGKVKSVSIDDIKLNYKGESKLSPKIDADSGVKYTVTYKSSDPKVAAVDNNGNVKGVKEWGKKTATITCTVTDEFGNVATDKCNVTVGYAWWQWIIGIVLFGWIWY